MKLLDAINSGLDFMRPGDRLSRSVKGGCFQWNVAGDFSDAQQIKQSAGLFTVDDIEVEDWEVRETVFKLKKMLLKGYLNYYRHDDFEEPYIKKLEYCQVQEAGYMPALDEHGEQLTKEIWVRDL